MKLFRYFGSVALCGAAIIFALAVTGGAHRAQATSTPGDANFQTVNLSDQSFGVAWTTAGAYTGSSLEYGTTCVGATNSVNETPSNGLAHLVNVTGLQPATTYYYKLVVNGVTDDNSGNCYTATTFAAQAIPPAPASIYGQANQGCTNGSAAAGALVVLSDGSSSSLAAISDSTGHWALPFGDLTDSTGAYINPTTGAAFTVGLTIGAGQTATLVTDGQSSDPPLYDGTSSTLGPYTVCTALAAAQITLDSGTLSRTYNGKPQGVTATTIPAGLTYSVTYNGSSTPPTAVGSYGLVATVTQAGYIGGTTGTLVIGKAPVRVIAGSPTIKYGQATPTIKHTFSGFVNNENSSVISGTTTCSTTARINSPAGTYPTSCTISGLSATNYSFVGVKGTLTKQLALPIFNYTGKPSYKHDTKVVLTATMVSKVTGEAVGGRSIKFTFGVGSTAQHCVVTTSHSGAASCTIKDLDGKAGPRTLKIAFAGDPRGANYDYTAASYEKTIQVT